MANPWFRMYHEFATDPKVQMLSEADQRRYIMLLCLRCSNEGVTLQDDEVAFQLRISSDEFAQTKATLIEKGLIDEHCQPTAWDKRQFASDSSTARVRRHRKNKKQQEEQGGNVTVTPPDTDTDSDTELNTPLESPKGEANAERSESKPPAKQKPQKRKTRLPEDFTLTKNRGNAALRYWADHQRRDLDVRHQWDQFVTHHKAKGSTMVDWDAAWKTWYVRAMEFSRGSPPPGQGSVVALPKAAQSAQRQAVRASLRNISNTDW